MGGDRARPPRRDRRGRCVLALTPSPSTLDSASPALASLLGRLYGLLVAGRLAEAETLEAALERRAGSDPRLWAGLAQVYRRLDRSADVIRSSRRASRLAPTNVDLRLAHARALLDEGRLAAARLQLDAAAACGPADAVEVLRLATFYAEALTPERGVAPLVEALEACAGDGRLLTALAVAERAVGDMPAARAHALEALRGDVISGEALWLAADVASDPPPEILLRALSLASEDDDTNRRVLALYARAKLIEARGEPATAFALVAEASRAVRRGLRYDVNVDVDHLDALRRTHTRRAIEAAQIRYLDAKPVFVVGLPRTGTTLVERILGSHSELSLVGEPPAFDRALQDHPSVGPDESLARWRLRALQFDLAPVARDYSTEIGALSGGGRRVVDKRPGNILNVGLILAAFSRAAVIVVERDPLDAGWALFKTPFAPGAHPYSYDLDDLGRYIAAHRRLTRHWRELNDARILFVRYEDVVGDLEVVARRLVAHCGLTWEAGCLDYARSVAPATTASASSVRRPIYTRSIGSGARQGTRLDALAAHLEI